VTRVSIASLMIVATCGLAGCPAEAPTPNTDGSCPDVAPLREGCGNHFQHCYYTVYCSAQVDCFCTEGGNWSCAAPPGLASCADCAGLFPDDCVRKFYGEDTGVHSDGGLDGATDSATE